MAASLSRKLYSTQEAAPWVITDDARKKVRKTKIVCVPHAPNSATLVLNMIHSNNFSFRSRRPLASKVASGVLRLLIKTMCTTADDLQVDIDASSNLALLSGELNAVSVTASRICFNGYAVSGGAAVYTDQVSISTTYPGTLIAALPRLTKPFSVSVQAAFTENDLNREGPVRDALQALLRQIIATGLSGAVGRALPVDIGGVTCELDSVELSDAETERKTSRLAWSLKHPHEAGGKIILHAHATLSSGRMFRFSVRTGLCFVDEGTIVKLSAPELIWRNISVPMVTIDTIGVKLDDATKLTALEIDKGKLSADGIFVMLPPPSTSRQINTRTKSSRATTATPSRTNSDSMRTRRRILRGPGD